MANLTGKDLRKINFYGANLFGAKLTKAKLRKANFIKADLRRTDLTQANLSVADLNEANLSYAKLTRANLCEADLTRAKLCNADLVGANLTGARLVRTDLQGADLTGCKIYGISVWGVNLQNTIQFNLVITPPNESTITVDNLEVAQFIYLLLNNEKIRDVIDAITTKAVLILGRFSAERKGILDAIRNELRKRNYLPILFDFARPTSRDLTETICTLAHLARFIIADITDPQSVPQELQAIVPTLAVPIQPILESSKQQYSMFADFMKYHWVLPTYRYKNLKDLLLSLGDKIIAPAEAKSQELLQKKAGYVRLE